MTKVATCFWGDLLVLPEGDMFCYWFFIAIDSGPQIMKIPHHEKMLEPLYHQNAISVTCLIYRKSRIEGFPKFMIFRPGFFGIPF